MQLTNEYAIKLAETYLKNMYGTIPEDLSVDDEVDAFLKGFEVGLNKSRAESKMFKGGFFNVVPRNWGKTTECINGFMKDPANSLLIVKDFNTKEKLIATTSFLNFYRDKVKPAEGHLFKGLRTKNIFIDDYSTFRNITQENLSNDIPLISENLYVWTSMNDDLDFTLLELIRSSPESFVETFKNKLPNHNLGIHFKNKVEDIQKSLISNRLLKINIMNKDSTMSYSLCN